MSTTIEQSKKETINLGLPLVFIDSIHFFFLFFFLSNSSVSLLKKFKGK